MRLPGRHDQPLTPLELTEADVVAFGEQVQSGFGGQAQWRRKGDHEELVIWLHPDAHHYLPPGVYVIAVGNTLEPVGPDGRGGVIQGVQFLLGRDYDSGAIKVVRSGLREHRTVYTSTPEGTPEGGDE